MENISGLGRARIKNILLGRVPEKYRQRYRDEQIKANLSRMFGLSVYMLTIQIFLNIINALKPAGNNAGGLDFFAGLSMASMGIAAVFVLISIQCQKGKIKNQKLLHILPYILLYLYSIIQMALFSLKVQNGFGGMNGYIISMILISFSLIMKPILNIANITVCMGFAMAVMYSVQKRSEQQDVFLIADTWVNLLIVTILVLCMSTLMYVMFVNSFINRVKMEESVEQATALARIDTLTGAMNRRGFFEMLVEGWPRLKERDCKVTVVMFDIDFFKAYNDHYGHLAGDNCLFEVASVLRRYFDNHNGRFCRFGGEEFLAIFSPEPDKSSWEIVEAARKAVEDLNLAGAASDKVTVSAGFVTADAAASDYEKLINQADIALYHSKRSGRNRISEYEDGQGDKAIYVRNEYFPEEPEYSGSEKRSN